MAEQATGGLTAKGAALAGVGVLVVAAVATFFVVPPGPQALGAWLGLVFGGLSGAAGLFLVIRALPQQGTQALLAAIGTSFLMRVVFIGLGLVVALKSGAEPISFTFAFFTLFVASAALEGLVAAGASRPRAS